MLKNKMDIVELISFMKQDASDQLSWSEKKEVSAWTACALYLGFIITFLINLEKIPIHFIVWQITLIVIVSTITLSIVFFLYASFNSIYYSSSYYLASKKIIFKLINDSSIINNCNFEFKKDNVHPEFLQDEIEKRLMLERPEYGHKRPIFIVRDFWGRIISKKFRKKKTNWSNHANRESIIYSLIIIFYLIFLSFILIPKNNILEERRPHFERKGIVFNKNLYQNH